jgi:hypothetical protein
MFETQYLLMSMIYSLRFLLFRYKKQCVKLITQFKAAQNLTKDYVPDIKKFMADYRVLLRRMLYAK